MSKTTVTFEFKPMSVQVDGEGLSDKQLLALAQQEVAKKMQIDFPQGFRLARTQGNCLTFDTAMPGVVIEHDQCGMGVVLKVNKKTLNVAFANVGVMQGPPSVYKTPEKKVNPEKVVWGKRYKAIKWDEGDTAFFVNGDKIIPVVVGESRGSKTKAYVIGGEGRSFSLPNASMNRLFDTKKEAEVFKK